MRAYQIVPIIVIALALPASAQQSDRSLRHQIESVVSSYAENFNKQNAAGIAALYAQGGKQVNAAGVHTSIEEVYQNAFKLGFNRQEVTVGEVSSIAPDVALGIGEFANSGQGKDGALAVRGRWTAVYTRENGVLKIRLLTGLPIPPPKQL